MKAMLISDGATLRPAARQLAFTFVVVDVIILLASGSPAAGTAGLTAMVPYMLLFTLATTDETSGWERLRVTLPHGRVAAVRGRYMCLLLAAVATMGFAIALNLVLVAALGAVPEVFARFGGLALDAETVTAILGSSVAGTAFSLVFCAATLPFVFRSGITTATRIVPVVVLCFIMGLGIALNGMALPAEEEIPFAVVLAVFAAVAIVFTLASMVLSQRFYARREF